MKAKKKNTPRKNKKTEHIFADCGGYPRCIKCGADEDDAFVGGLKCGERQTYTKVELDK